MRFELLFFPSLEKVTTCISKYTRFNHIDAFNSGILDDETGKRIDSEKMKAELQKEIDEYRKELEQVKENKLNGWERYQEMKKIKEYYESLWKDVCRPAQRGLSYWCKINCY